MSGIILKFYYYYQTCQITREVPSCTIKVLQVTCIGSVTVIIVLVVVVVIAYSCIAGQFSLLLFDEEGICTYILNHARKHNPKSSKDVFEWIWQQIVVPCLYKTGCQGIWMVSLFVVKTSHSSLNAHPDAEVKHIRFRGLHYLPYYFNLELIPENVSVLSHCTIGPVPSCVVHQKLDFLITGSFHPTECHHREHFSLLRTSLAHEGRQATFC